MQLTCQLLPKYLIGWFLSKAPQGRNYHNTRIMLPKWRLATRKFCCDVCQFRFLPLAIDVEIKQKTMHVEWCPRDDLDPEAVSGSSTNKKSHFVAYFLCFFKLEEQKKAGNCEENRLSCRVWSYFGYIFVLTF